VLPRIEYSVQVPVSVDVAFEAFQNLDRLLHRGIYSEISWTEGEPWQVGSRLRLVVEKPISTTISSVVIACSPPRAVTFLCHAIGITVEERAIFGPDLKGGARIRLISEFVGTSTELPDETIRRAFSFLCKDALDSVARLCQLGTSGIASGE
jgi:hypothetical protein